jgi:hypothetical protein
MVKCLYGNKKTNQKSTQARAETQAGRKLSAAGIVFSIFQSLANAGSLIVTWLLKPYLRVTKLDFRRVMRGYKEKIQLKKKVR